MTEVPEPWPSPPCRGSLAAITCKTSSPAPLLARWRTAWAKPSTLLRSTLPSQCLNMPSVFRKHYASKIFLLSFSPSGRPTAKQICDLMRRPLRSGPPMNNALAKPARGNFRHRRRSCPTIGLILLPLFRFGHTSFCTVRTSLAPEYAKSGHATGARKGSGKPTPSGRRFIFTCQEGQGPAAKALRFRAQ